MVDAGGGCAPSRGLEYSAAGITVSPDGANLYMVSGLGLNEGELTDFNRDELSGAITQAECFNEDGSIGCTQGRSLSGEQSVAVSPDRGNVYVASRGAWPGFASGGGLAVFRRNRNTGGLQEVACIGKDTGCDGNDGLTSATSVVVSPDGNHVYVGATNALITYRRDQVDGTLTRTGCLSDGQSADACAHDKRTELLAELGMSPDGRNVYGEGAAFTPVALGRNPTSGALSFLDCVGPQSSCAGYGALVAHLAISPDGLNVYGVTAGSFDNFMTGKGGNLLVFDRDPRTGLLSPAACFGASLASSACTPSTHVGSPAGVAVAADGRSVYVIDGSSWTTIGTLTVFARDPVTGALSESGCFTQGPSSGACQGAYALGAPRALATSPDGRNVYVASVPTRIATFGLAVGIAGTPLQVAGDGTMMARLACPSAAGRCRGVLTLRTLNAVLTRQHRRLRRIHVNLASASFSLAGNQTSALALRLATAARSLFARHRSLSARLTVHAQGLIAADTVRTVVVHG
jgi:DNA-binding beta-propeller fold protein YncE